MRSDLDLGGVLISPFVAYAACALLILVVMRRLSARLRVARYVTNPPLAEAGLYLCLLALLIVLF